MRAIVVILPVLVAASGCLQASDAKSEAQGPEAKPPAAERTYEVIPGEAIGPIRLGMKAKEFPPGTSSKSGFGAIEGINIMIENGQVDDVWISNLRAFEGRLVFRDRVISPADSFHRLVRIFGGCNADVLVNTIIYNCRAGVALLPSEFNDSVQLRIRRPAGD